MDTGTAGIFIAEPSMYICPLGHTSRYPFTMFVEDVGDTGNLCSTCLMDLLKLRVPTMKVVEDA